MNLDDFGKMALERYSMTVDKYNKLVNKSKTLETRDKFADQFMADAPELAEFNAEIERLDSELESVKMRRLIEATPLIEPAYQKALSEVGVDPEAVKTLRKEIAAGSKFLTVSYGDDVLEGTPKPEQMRVTGTASGTGTSRRIRGFDIFVNGEKATLKNAEGILKSTFTAAAKVLDVPVPELQEAFIKEAGSEDYRNEAFPTIVDFDFNGKNIRVVKVDDSDEE
jgi:hypothetical protein